MILNTENSNIFLDTNDFDDENFKVDEFIIEIRKYSDLKILLKSLKDYDETLRSEITRILNKEYIDYIILSSTIVEIDKYFKRVTSCFGKLKNIIFEEKSRLDRTLSSANVIISEKTSVQKIKKHVNCVIFIFERLERIENSHARYCHANIPLIQLERMALDLNEIQFYLNDVLFMKQLHQNKEKLEKTVEKIECYLGSQLVHTIKENNVQNMMNILHIYSILNKREEVEVIFRKKYVKTFMIRHLTEENIIKFGLVKVYDNILNFISQFCTLFSRSADEHTNGIYDYDFVVNAVWTETLEHLLCVLPNNVYTPADTQRFHSDYSATMAFLQRLEQYFGMLTSIKLLREQYIYEQFLKKWNLDAYFKMRFIENAGNFERILLYTNQNMELPSHQDAVYALRSSTTLMECLNLCWNDKVFIQPLCHEFWKLTLQFISRYNTWSLSCIKADETGGPTYKTAAAIIMDIEQIQMDYEKLFSNKICKKIDKTVIESAFLDSMKQLKGIASYVEKVTVDSLIKQCSYHIASVAGIPKLYLKTNRNAPTKPSMYALSICNSLSDFLSDTDSLISKERKKFIIKCVTDTVLDEWIRAIHDVRASIKKMEESLKVLKRLKNKPQDHSKSDGVSDDEKIKMQLLLDADVIEDFFRKLETENIEKISRLKDFVSVF